MSVRALTKVFSYSESTLAARLVLLVLADAAHDDGVTWVSQVTIAEKAKVNEATVRYSLTALRKLGEVETRKAQRGRKRINVYRVTLPGIEEPDYDRLPFSLTKPFSTTAQSARPSDGDDRVSTSLTTAQSDVKPGSSPSLEPEGGPVGANAPSGEAPDVPPKIVLTEGRNLPLDALCEVGGVEPDSPRIGQALAALNGKAGEPGIRHLFWKEATRWAAEHDALDRLDELREEPERFALALERGIRRKAEVYRQQMPGAMLTPTALRLWWFDVEKKRASGAMTPDEIAAFAG